MEIITNAPKVAALFDELNRQITIRRLELFNLLGAAFVKNVQDRISSQDEGRWAQASKWHKAKKGDAARILEGAGSFVKFKASGERLDVIGETGQDWTLTQHHEGFENEETPGRVTIDIVNPSPLGLGGGTREFSWIDGATGKTAARKIWPDGGEAYAISQPIASKWLEKVVADVLAKKPSLGSLA